MFPEFYYQESLDELAYRHTPTNRLNVPRLLKGQAAWVSHSAGMETKNKTLIFDYATILEGVTDRKTTDSNARNSIIKNFRAIAILGFDILIHVGFNQFLPFKNEGEVEVAIKNFRKAPFSFTPPSGSTLEQTVAKKLARPLDHVLLLKPRRLSNDTSNLSGAFDQSESSSVFEQLEFTYDDLYLLFIKVLYLKGEITKQLTLKLGLEGQSFQLPPAIQQIYNENHLNLIKLEELTVSGGRRPFNSDEFTLFYLILSANHKLERLNLNAALPSQDWDITNIHLHHLTEVSLKNLNWILQDRPDSGEALLRKIFTDSNHLKKIELDDYALIKPFISEMNFSELESLSICFSRDEPSFDSSFITILKEAPNLKHLKIIGASFKLPDTETIPLTNLETIHFNDGECDLRSMHALLSHSSHLKHFKFNYCKISNEHSISESAQWLNTLESIIYSPQNKACTHFFISLIAENAPHLKKLTLEGSSDELNTKILPLKTGQDTPYFSHLEALTIISERDRPYLNAEILAKILTNTPELKKLLLQGFSLNNSFLWPCLNKLSSLTLEDCEPDKATLSKHLLQTPNLEELCISDYNKQIQDIDDRGQLDLSALTHLRRCKLDVDDYSFKTMSHVLEQLPSIEKFGSIFDFKRDVKPGLFNANDLSKKDIEHFTAMLPIGAYLIKTSAKTKPNPSPERRPLFNPQGGVKTMDADTSNKTSAFNLKRIFYSRDENHPPPNLYRLEAYNELQLNESGASTPFSLTNQPEDPRLKSASPIKCPQDTYSNLFHSLPERQARSYYGKQSLTLTQQWQALASLSPQERLTHYHVEPDVEVDIQYSERDNLYYVRCPMSSVPPAQAIEIDFIVNIPESLTIQALPEPVQRLIKRIQNFGEGQLEITSACASGSEYISAINEQKVGACRHRAVVFMAEIKRMHPEFNVRYIGNDCHAYAEVYHEGQWVECQLGGYPAQLNIDNSSKPRELKALPDQAESELTEAGQDKQASLQYFKATSSVQQVFNNDKDYALSLVNQPNHKRLLQVQQASDIRGLSNAIEAVCVETKRPFYYIHSPEDLICSARYIKKVENKGEIKNGPGGPLHDFLRQHTDGNNHPILLINYNNFTASEVVRFNALLDDTRSADGTALPSDISIIGLIDPKNPNAYDGVDFYSRFDEVKQAALTGNALPSTLINQIPAISLNNSVSDLNMVDTAEDKIMLDAGETVSINFYGSPNWEEIMLGRWRLDGHHLTFIEGELVQALKNNAKKIILAIAPWGNSKFLRFWESALIRNYIEFDGQQYPLPEIYGSTHYDWQAAANSIQLNPEPIPPDDAIILNPTNYADMLGQFHCNANDDTIVEQEGLIEQHAGSLMSVYLTAPLASGAWAQLIDRCKQAEVTLHVTLAPRCLLPPALKIPPPQHNPIQIPVWNNTMPESDAVIQSDDIDLTVALLKAHKVIDVSEVDSANLITKIDGQFDENAMQFKFKHLQGPLLIALAHNETIVLKGRFSSELVDQLNIICHQRRVNGNITGTLIIVKNSAQSFPLTDTYQHAVTTQQKIDALGLSHSLIPEHTLSRLSFAEIDSLNRHILDDNQASVDSIRMGLSELPSSGEPMPFKPEEAAHIAKTFISQRIEQVEMSLNRSPILFLAGKTAVGKTTFIERIWAEAHGPLYIGEEQMHAWAKGGGTLFIDECNITRRDWSEFEGLFVEPKGIMIDNCYYPLTPEHKVIFAGNPVDYGGGRKTPTLLQRHPNCVIFEPMPPAYIYHEMLQPILGSIDAAQPILNIADYLSRLDRDKVLISPRELTSMALLTKCHCMKYPDADPVKVAQHFAYAIGKTLVPVAIQKTFEKQFKPDDYIANERYLPDNFTLNETNKPTLHLINELLDLRSMRQSPKNLIPSSGGLGGLILEGEPGIGKTELVIKTLKQAKVEFIVIPTSMPIEERKEALINAWDQGLIVVIDEINSNAIIERLLNDLLMGTYQNKKPSQPGFTLIGTQNPATMSGRQQAGQALQRRLLTLRISEGSPNEMIEIVLSKGLDSRRATKLVDEYIYLKSRRPAGFEELCFRDLLKKAKHLTAAAAASPSRGVSASLNSATNKKRFFSHADSPVPSPQDPSLQPGESKRSRNNLS